MRNYFKLQQQLFIRLLFLLGAYFIVRTIFLLNNFRYFDPNAHETAIAFVAGLRFDISAILYTNIFFIILQILPGRWKYSNTVHQISKWLYVTVNSFCLLFNFIDIEYFSFINKRSTFDLFHMAGTSLDIWGLIPLFIIDYWFVAVTWAAVSAGLYFSYPKHKIQSQTSIKNIKTTLISVLYETSACVILFLLFLTGARGGIQLKPLGMLSAFQYIETQKVALVTNTTFSIIKSYSKQETIPSGFFNNDEEVALVFNPVQQFSSADNIPKNSNVIVIILESFSAEYSALLSNSTQGYMPFIDSLMQQSFYFTKAYANGKKSIESLPSILSSLPALTDIPYINSSFNTNRIMSIPQILNKYGYQSYFFHGGANGTMGFDNFTKAAGIKNYMGLNQYNGKKDDLDGNWGVYDEPYLQYVANNLNTIKQPFFAGIYTLSSHHPYKIPEQYTGKFPTGTNPIHQSVAYADYAVKQFFEQIKNTAWYKNTLFVFTSDHTAQSDTPMFKTMYGNYLVPLFFFSPTDENLKGKNCYTAQHTDIFPSIVDYLNLDETIVSYGSSVFDRNSGWTINHTNNIYQFINDTTLTQFDGENLTALYNLNKDTLLKNNLIFKINENTLPQLKLEKAILQDYSTRLIYNKLYQ